MENNFKMGLKVTEPESSAKQDKSMIQEIENISEKNEKRKERINSQNVEEILMIKVEKASSVSELIGILKGDDYGFFLQQNYQMSKLSSANLETSLNNTNLNKVIKSKIKKMYQPILQQHMEHSELLEVANEFKELRCIEDETKIPNLYGLSEIGTKLGDKLMDEEVIHVPTENKFLKNAIRDQYMTAGYIEKGEMHGNHIEKMKLAQVQTEGGNDYFLIEDGELLSILSTTEKVALRMDRHKLTEIEYTNEFTPEIFERVEKNATLLTQEEKEPPLKNLYRETPEIKLKEGVTSLEQVNYIPKFRGKEQTQS